MDSSILVVDDEEYYREELESLLSKEGHKVKTSATGEEAIELLRKVKKGEIAVDLLILDIRLVGRGRFSGELAGIEVLKELREKIGLEIPVVVTTAYGDKRIDGVKVGPKLLELGAEDYLEKPIDWVELKFVIKRALEKQRLLGELQRAKDEIEYYKSKEDERCNFSNIIGKSKSLKDVFNLIERVAKTDATVLVLGESGTGKELVAGAIHYSSQRKDKPFVKINCVAIPEDLLEAELFGIEKNVATGVAGRMGRFEQTQCGTIFLDEIGDMSPSLQAKLLRVLQEREIEKIGGRKAIKVDVRVISATNKDLKKQIKKNKFRDDLYFRLNVFPISLPPLRKRREDIPLLIKHFIERYAKETKKPVVKISEGAEELLIQYDYPGNVRELENLIERAIILTDGDTILLEALPELKKREEPAL